MKILTMLSIASLGLLSATTSFADFTSLNCWSDYEGIKNINITRCAGTDLYDVSITRTGSNTPAVYAESVHCQNIPNSGAGTFVSLIHCEGNGTRVVVGHSNTTWADRDASGNLFSRETGAEVQFVLSGKAGQEFPFQSFTFSPSECKQVN